MRRAHNGHRIGSYSRMLSSTIVGRRLARVCVSSVAVRGPYPRLASWVGFKRPYSCANCSTIASIKYRISMHVTMSRGPHASNV